MSMTRVVILANSSKLNHRCLAGIELDTGSWVRPVSNLEGGAVPKTMMRINNRFPELLDIIDIPLDKTGPDFDFESENRTILDGEWHFVEKADVADVMKYVEMPDYVLHNAERYCTLEEMQQKPFEQRKTLQLIKAEDFHVIDDPFLGQAHKWKGILESEHKKILVNITDPMFLQKLNTGHIPSQECLLTMSLSLPFEPDDWEGSPPCWKLIAGVIEL